MSTDTVCLFREDVRRLARPPAVAERVEEGTLEVERPGRSTFTTTDAPDAA